MLFAFSIGKLFDKITHPIQSLKMLILGGLRLLAFTLDKIIYGFIIKVYDIFRLLCNGKIAEDGLISDIAFRIGLILGIVMFFYVTFDFIQILIDPDKLTDKDKGPVNIIKKFIVVIVLLGTSSFIFNFLYNFQVTILGSDDNGPSVLEKLILPYQVNTDNFGRAIASNFMQNFYKMNDVASSSSTPEDEKLDYKTCEEEAKALSDEIAQYGSFISGYKCLNARFEADDDFEYFIEFDGLLSVIVGLIVLWMIIMYCISVGMRIIQLAVLQIISPVAFVSYLSPKKDGMFGKFWKTYFATYIDVFIRVAIIDFVVLLSGLILEDSSDSFWQSVGGVENMDRSTHFWLSVFMIIALLSFAKKLPDLVKKFLPDTASSGLSFLQTPKQVFEDVTKSPLLTPVKEPATLLAKKTVGGIDAVRHGQKFSTGWSRNKGRFGTWLDKQRQTYTPFGYEASQKKVEGAKEVGTIDDQWNSGANIAYTLMTELGLGSYGEENGWDKAFKGQASQEVNYRKVFKHEEFIKSKMNVDRESSVEDDLRRLQQQVNLEGADKAFSDGPKVINGKTYDSGNVNDLIKDLEDQVKKVEGLKNVHDSISKQYQDDANKEAAYKFVKNNEVNPARPDVNRTTRGIEGRPDNR